MPTAPRPGSLWGRLSPCPRPCRGPLPAAGRKGNWAPGPPLCRRRCRGAGPGRAELSRAGAAPRGHGRGWERVWVRVRAAAAAAGLRSGRRQRRLQPGRGAAGRLLGRAGQLLRLRRGFLRPRLLLVSARPRRPVATPPGPPRFSGGTARAPRAAAGAFWGARLVGFVAWSPQGLRR